MAPSAAGRRCTREAFANVPNWGGRQMEGNSALHRPQEGHRDRRAESCVRLRRHCVLQDQDSRSHYSVEVVCSAS